MAVAGYLAPEYAPDTGSLWYHVLYGHVPGHQLDVIYRPKVPHESLRPPHFGNLRAVIVDVFRAPPAERQSFALANLSLNDPDHRPGHGGIALLTGARVKDIRDHAGRIEPVFEHAALVVDQPLDAEGLHRACQEFLEFFGIWGPNWYRNYYQAKDTERLTLLSKYVGYFTELSSPAGGTPQRRWKPAAGVDTLPYNQIVIRHDPETPIFQLLRPAAQLATFLYYTKIRWNFIGCDQGGIQELYRIARDEVRIQFTSSDAKPSSGVRTCDITLSELQRILQKEEELAALFGLIDAAQLRTGQFPLERPEPRETPLPNPTEVIEAVAAPAPTPPPKPLGKWLIPLGLAVPALGVLFIVFRHQQFPRPLPPARPDMGSVSADPAVIKQQLPTNTNPHPVPPQDKPAVVVQVQPQTPIVPSNPLERVVTPTPVQPKQPEKKQPPAPPKPPRVAKPTKSTIKQFVAEINIDIDWYKCCRFCLLLREPNMVDPLDQKLDELEKVRNKALSMPDIDSLAKEMYLKPTADEWRKRQWNTLDQKIRDTCGPHPETKCTSR